MNKPKLKFKIDQQKDVQTFFAFNILKIDENKVVCRNELLARSC